MRYLNLHTLTITKSFWDLIRSHEISQYLLRSPKIFWGSIYWDLKYQLIWHSAFNFDTWHLTFDIDLLLTLICFWHLTIDIWQLIFDIYAEFVWLHCCFAQHSNASYSTLLHTLQIFAIFVYFALVPSHALGASTSRAATLFVTKVRAWFDFCDKSIIVCCNFCN